MRNFSGFSPKPSIRWCDLTVIPCHISFRCSMNILLAMVGRSTNGETFQGSPFSEQGQSLKVAASVGAAKKIAEKLDLGSPFIVRSSDLKMQSTKIQDSPSAPPTEFVETLCKRSP